MKNNKQLIWSIVSFALALASIGIVLAQSRELTFSYMYTMLRESNPFWILLAVICMVGYILFEAASLWQLLKSLGFKNTFGQAVTYSAADIYCAAITPSATGGQPVCAWFMRRDGVPMGYITAILAQYLVLHTFATVTISVLAMFIWPHVFIEYSVLGKILICLGYLIMVGLALLFLMLLRKENFIYKKGCGIIDWLTKKHVIKRNEHWKMKLQGWLNDYTTGIQAMTGKGKILVAVYVYNILQRISQTLVPSLVYLAQGGSGENAGTVFASQCFTTIGSFGIPIPGGMGVADYLLYNGMRSFMDRESAQQLELLARSFSF